MTNGIRTDETGAPIFTEGMELADLGLQSELIRMITEGADITELQDFIRQGYDPRTNRLIEQGTQQYQDLLDAPAAYGEDELNTFRSLISGDFFTDEMAGSFRERARRGMEGTRQNMMADLSARGLATSGGEMGSALGRLSAEENINFQDIASREFLNAIGMGTHGLGAADTAMLNRAQTGFGMGANLRDFIESSQMNRVGIGAELARMKKEDYFGLMGMSSDYRKYQQQQPSTAQQIGSAALGFGVQAATGGYTPTNFTNPAGDIGSMYDNTDLGQDYTQMFA